MANRIAGEHCGRSAVDRQLDQAKIRAWDEIAPSWTKTRES